MKTFYFILAVLVLPILYKRSEMLYTSVKQKNKDHVKVNLVFLFAVLVVTTGIVLVAL